MAKEEIQVNIDLRVRPIKLGFLVRPGDWSDLYSSVVAATRFWAGIHSVLVPAYRRRPSGWGGRMPAREIVAGYLHKGAVDYLIDLTGGAVDHGFPEERVRSIEDLLSESWEIAGHEGVPVAYLFHHLFRKELRFSPRDAPQIKRPVWQTPGWKPAMAAYFGAFGDDANGRLTAELYDEYLSPVEEVVSATNFLELFDSHYPLRVGAMRVRAYSPIWDPDVLFLMDPQSWLDVVDFWNLRAMGFRVRPVPLPWQDDLTEASVALAQRVHVPLRRNPQVMRRLKVLVSRSTQAADWSPTIDSLRDLAPGEWVVNESYPAIWSARPHRWVADPAPRLELVCEDRTVESVATDGRFTVPAAAPPFFEDEPFPDASWVNRLRLRTYAGGPEVAGPLPEMPNARRLFSATGEPVWTTVSGIQLVVRWPNWTHHFALPNANVVFQEWLDRKSYRAVISPPGHLANKLVHRMGGKWGVGVLAQRPLIELFARMSRGGIETESLVDGEVPTTAQTAAVSGPELLEVLRPSEEQDRERGKARAKRTLERLTEQGVLELGLRLPCPECQHHSWFALGQLDTALECPRCVTEFPFPLADPPSGGSWRYRLVGPFAVAGLAHGAYTVALSLRFLTAEMRGSVTWIPSVVLKRQGRRDAEADFAGFYAPEHSRSPEVVPFFGECKSLSGRFERKDVARMEELARDFPEAVLLFCTLRDHLSKEERRRIRGLCSRVDAQWRGRGAAGRVVVLTGYELFGADMLKRWWAEHPHREDAGLPERPRVQDLEELAEWTSRLHLTDWA